MGSKSKLRQSENAVKIVQRDKEQNPDQFTSSNKKVSVIGARSIKKMFIEFTRLEDGRLKAEDGQTYEEMPQFTYFLNSKFNLNGVVSEWQDTVVAVYCRVI